MKPFKSRVFLALAVLTLVSTSVFASSHREAPITALDRSADITDWYAFVSYDHYRSVAQNVLDSADIVREGCYANHAPFPLQSRVH